MRTLIIGGTGLISTSITRFLVERGDDVTLYNRGKSEARMPEGPRRITGDRRDFDAFEAQMRAAGRWDCVIDMVCFEPDEARSLIRAFAPAKGDQGRVGQVILCSTVDVYTKPAGRLPVREDEPRHPDPIFSYAHKKAECEEILFAAHRRGDFPVTIIRPAHTYGESGKLVHSLGWRTTLIDRIRKGRPIIVHGDGNSLWSSCHIDDVARAFVAAMGNERALGRAYHVTGEEWMTWNRYYAGIAEALGVPSPLCVHIPTDLLAAALPTEAHWCKVNFQFNNLFDNSAAHADLGFRYTIPWVEGVRRTIGWLEARDAIENWEADPLTDRVIAAWERLGAAMVSGLA